MQELAGISNRRNLLLNGKKRPQKDKNKCKRKLKLMPDENRKISF
jgi:hypothetical protein